MSEQPLASKQDQSKHARQDTGTSGVGDSSVNGKSNQVKEVSSKIDSNSVLIRAWNDPIKRSSFDVHEQLLPAQSRQIDIYKTVRTWLSSNTIYSANITLIFLWRSSSCLDVNRDFPQGLMRTLSAAMQPFDVVIDIGACYGDSAIPLSTNANLLLAFEPNPHSFKVLKANADLNTGVNIVPYNLAVGEDEELTFFYGGDFCNGGKWGEWKMGDTGEKPVQVRSVNLPRFLTLNHPGLIPRVGFIKIDVEGYDSRILATLGPILVASSPLVVVEWFLRYRDLAKPDECTTGSRELFHAISAVGYTPFRETRPDIPVQGCESRNWVPDLLLRPRAAVVGR